MQGALLICMAAVMLSYELFHYSSSVEDLSPDDIITTVSLSAAQLHEPTLSCAIL